jgi:MFS family permease
LVFIVSANPNAESYEELCGNRAGRLTSRLDVRAVAVAGVGFFLDSYDIFAINLITTFLGLTFWSGGPEDAINGFGGNYGTLPTPVNTALKASTSAGIVVGQVLFGWLADVFGRRRMYGIELAIIILATLSCALASPSQSMSSTGLLVFWRVVMVSLLFTAAPLGAGLTVSDRHRASGLAAITRSPASSHPSSHRQGGAAA